MRQWITYYFASPKREGEHINLSMLSRWPRDKAVATTVLCAHQVLFEGTELRGSVNACGIILIRAGLSLSPRSGGGCLSSRFLQSKACLV